MNRLACLITISVTALTTACSSNSSSTPSEDQYDDTAQALGSTTSTGSGGGETGSMADVVSLSTGGTITGFTTAGSGMFTGTHLGLDYSYTLACKDASGTLLGTCTDLTDTATAMVDWSGTLALPDFNSSVMRSGSWTVTGLQSGTATFNGTGSFTLGATVMSIFRPVTTMYTLTADATYDGVLINTTNHLLVGGDISYDVTATDDTTNTGSGSSSDSKFDIAAKLTFAADGTTTLVLDGDHTYTVNQATGVVVKSS